jgi:methyl-accepting chemotaxis protein
MTRGSTELVRLLGEAPPAPEASPMIEVAAIARDISSKTSTTVQSLQFEDMATQLLQHVGRRLATLEVFSKEMSLLHPDPAGHSVPLTDAAVDQLYRLLDQHRAELALVEHKSVQQQSLDSGGIELF